MKGTRSRRTGRDGRVGGAASGRVDGPGGPVRGRPGYSITELLIALFVLGLIMVIAVPVIEVVRFRMDGAARGAVSALVSAQRLAVKRQHDVVVIFDTANRRLLIHQDRDADGVKDAGEPIRQVVLEDVVFGAGHAPLYGTDGSVITFTEVQDGQPVVRFLRNGSASEDGAFYLTSPRGVLDDDYAKDARMIRVERSTGRATWYEYDPPEWTEEF